MRNIYALGFGVAYIRGLMVGLIRAPESSDLFWDTGYHIYSLLILFLFTKPSIIDLKII